MPVIRNAPLGLRRDVDSQTSNGGTVPSLTTRRFTGHEMVDGVLNLIHMNGRLFDPGLGRFLQPDPVIQAPDNAQSWNAYTYCLNNPLTYVDPTGMMSIGSLLRIAAVLVVSYFTAGVASMYLVAGDIGAGLAIAAAGGFLAGWIGSGTLKGGLQGAFGAVLTAGIGVMGWSDAGQMAAQVVSGGIMESLQGGNFGNGFLAAGLTALAMPMVGEIDNNLGRTITGALAGGTISEATGGKFANGAISGAMQAAMAGHRSREVGARPLGKGEISDQTGAPKDVVSLLSDKKTRLQGFRKLVEWAGMIVSPDQIAYEDVDYFVTREGIGAAKTNMRTGLISFSNFAVSEDFWITLSYAEHEYGHWMDWRFNLGSPEEDQMRAYKFQTRDSNFGRAPKWFQDAVQDQLHIEEQRYRYCEAGYCAK